MYGCSSKGLQAEDGKGYGSGGGGTYVDLKYHSGSLRTSGSGKQGVCVVAWGSAVTDTSENRLFEESIDSGEYNTFTDIDAELNPENQVSDETQEPNKSQNQINEKSSIAFIENVLGYDLLDEMFLNTIRYTTNDLKEYPEFISEEILNSLDQEFPEGETLKLDMENYND